MPDLFMRLQENESEATGDCGCMLRLECGSDLASIYLCKVHEAAPDLLEACKAAITDWHSKPRNFHREEPAYLRILRAAVARAGTGKAAEGRTCRDCRHCMAAPGIPIDGEGCDMFETGGAFGHMFATGHKLGGSPELSCIHWIKREG